MKARWVVLMAIALGCTKQQRPPVLPQRSETLSRMLEGKHRYSLDWTIKKGDSILLEVNAKAVCNDGTFQLEVARKGVYPSGAPVVHKLEAIRTKTTLFTKVDRSSFVRWSEVIDEDMRLWRWTFGEAIDLWNFYNNCIKAHCKATHLKGHFPDLLEIYKAARAHNLEIHTAIVGPNNLPRDLDLTLKIDEYTLDLKFDSKPAKKVSIKPPEHWIPDRVQRPYHRIEEFEKALQKAGVPYTKGSYKIKSK